MPRKKPLAPSPLQAVLSGASHTYSCAPAPLQYAVARALARDGAELRQYVLGARRTLQAVATYCQVTARCQDLQDSSDSSPPGAPGGGGGDGPRGQSWLLLHAGL